MAAHLENPILLESDAQGRVVLPKGIRGKKKQTYYCKADNDGAITLVPIVGVITKNQAYFWTKRWQDGEQQASKDIQNNKVKKFSSRQLKKYLGAL